MKKILIFSVIILFLFGSIFAIYLKNLYFTGAVIEPDYTTYTRAICNESNFCQDYTIECDGDSFISMSPISGAIIQHPEDWKDPRENISEENFCKK